MMRRSTYLQERGFSEDPFAPRRAREGSEEDLLSSVFWMVPGFDEFIGNPATPQTRILYAPRGHGKTSHMLQVKKHVGSRSPRALVVELTDFNYILQAGTDDLSIYRYIELIRKATLEEINRKIMTDQQCRQTFEQSFSFRYFCVWLTRYSPDAAEQSRCLARLPDLESHEREIREYGPEAWLKKLAEFAADAGFASVYVLVDGVDETEKTCDETPQALALMSTMLKPLLVTQRLMHGCGFAFKFFIPKLLYEYMQNHNTGRLDCYSCFELQWQPGALEEILNLRLSHCSDGWINTFLQLCDEECDLVMQELIQAAAYPYRMIAWLDQVINRHCERVVDIDETIQVETIREVLQEVYCPPLTDVTLTCSLQDRRGEILTEYTFKAVVTTPSSNPDTLTYIWQVDGEEVLQKQSTRLTDTLCWQWERPGSKTVVVLVKNSQGSVTSSIDLTLQAPSNILWCDANSVFYLGNQKLDISGTPHKILQFLYDALEQDVSHEHLSRQLYNRNPDVHDVKSLQRHKSRLSSVLEKQYVFIHSPRGAYRLSRQGQKKDGGCSDQSG